MTQPGKETKLIPIPDESQDRWKQSIRNVKEYTEKLEGFDPEDFTQMNEQKKFEVRMLLNRAHLVLSEMESLLH